VAAVRAAEKVAPRAFEEARYFEGCLPIEVMAERGADTLAYGPMKPVGLRDPRTGRQPFAVVQLRQEDEAGSAFNLVGFQTRMTYGAQALVFRTIPGLGEAEFLRFGSVHRNTFVNAPRLLDATLALRALPGVYLAGQVTGVEGYVESAACGLLVGVMLANTLAGRAAVPPPATTALGGLARYLQTERPDFQPSNINWSMVAPLLGTRLRKRDRYEAMAQRALADLAPWAAEATATLAGTPVVPREPAAAPTAPAEPIAECEAASATPPVSFADPGAPLP
jgi:methylenetetrahydrofolate--tRNA-(uracil-5-)-methyltransferase